ncbi:MAG: hypothetical protein ACRCY3_16235, partial [Sphingorhabdus sp.]
LASSMPSRSGVGGFSPGATLTDPTPTPWSLSDQSGGPIPPRLKGRSLEEWPFHRTLTPNEAMLFRFSAITFNTHRIHYDAPYAINDEGYRGLVVHGPLMSSLLLDLVGREFGQNKAKTFSFRAQSPAFANEPLHLVGKREGEILTLAALGGDGRTCVTAEARL